MSWQYFTHDELACPCCRKSKMDDEFMECLEGMREELDFPFVISSAYRCPEYNAKISSTGLKGPHTTGKAVDIAVFGERAYRIVTDVENWGITGVGIKQHGDNRERFIHLDSLTKYDGYPRPRV